MRWLAACALVFAPAAQAADGDLRANFCSGSWCVTEYLLCDGDHTATDCAEIDLHSETATGIPAHIVASINNYNGGCGATVTVRGLAEALGMPSVIGALTPAGTSAVPVDPMAFRFVDAVVTTGVGCTDIELVLSLWYPRLEAP